MDLIKQNAKYVLFIILVLNIVSIGFFKIAFYISKFLIISQRNESHHIIHLNYYFFYGK